MILQSFKVPCGGQPRLTVWSRPIVANPLYGPICTSRAETVAPRKAPRVVLAAAAAVLDGSSSDDAALLAAAQRVSSLRQTAEAEAEATSMVTTRFIVPHFVTKPGQQLFLTGSTPELGEWDASAAVPLDWHEGHQHMAVVRLPTSRIVQVKLVLKENGRPLLTEEGDPRDIMLLPVDSAEGGSEPASQQAELRTAAAQPDYQILCHFGNTEAAQILRLPVVLPARELGDRRVLCKFVVMLDHLKLEARQYPVVVGAAEELGSWKAESGVKLIRQVGGYWTKRVELPLVGNDIQAKVVICNADGKPVAWEPGSTNRVLPAHPVTAAPAMHIFLCRWSQPDFTPVVSVPVEYENAAKEYIKMLDSAQSEIGLMRKAVTAKSQQCQALESELSASRRAERALREEVSALRSDMAYIMQEAEAAQQDELSARQEAAALQEQLQEMGENYERQIAFLEAKLDEMEAEIFSLHEQLAAKLAAAHDSGNGFNGRSLSPSYEYEESRVMNRSNWR